MLTQVCRLVSEQGESSDTFNVSLFEIKYSNVITPWIPGRLFWRPVETERFQLVANESVKVGQPANRDDSLYWIEQIYQRAGLAEGERVGWLAVAPRVKEVPVLVDERLERLLEVELEALGIKA